MRKSGGLGEREVGIERGRGVDLIWRESKIIGRGRDGGKKDRGKKFNGTRMKEEEGKNKSLTSSTRTRNSENIDIKGEEKKSQIPSTV